MSNLNIYMENKKGKSFYHAEGIYFKNKIVVKKGSIIKLEMSNAKSFKITDKILSLRNNPEIVDKNGNVLKDLEFNSPTSAAIFVCGYSVNGFLSWHVEKHINLKKYFGGK